MRTTIFTAALAALVASQGLAAQHNAPQINSPHSPPAKAPVGSIVLEYRAADGIIGISKGVAAVSEPSTGDFCVTPTKKLIPGTLPTVTVEWGASSGFALEAYLQSPVEDCGPKDIEVRTYDFNAGGYPVASDNVAFILYAP